MKRLISLAIGAALMSAGTAQAALITLDGNGFDVVYDDQLLGLFGAPTLSGSGLTIIFTPTNFKAESTGTQGTIFQNQSVTFDLIPDATKRVSKVKTTERGDYKIVDANPGSPTVQNPAVDVSGEIRLTNLWDGVSQEQSNLVKAAPLNVVCPDITCAPTQWAASASVTAPISWSDGLDLDVSPPTGAPTVRFFLQDFLTAQSFLSGDSAFIQKKLASSTITIDVDIDPIAPVPVPAALPLLASALGGLMTLGRRRRV